MKVIEIDQIRKQQKNTSDGDGGTEVPQSNTETADEDILVLGSDEAPERTDTDGDFEINQQSEHNEQDVGKEQNNEKEESIQIGDWIATDFGTNVFYVGKVTNVDLALKRGEAMFLKKNVGHKYKESSAQDKEIEELPRDRGHMCYFKKE
ncbi:Hypothetical predicted protein [Paramuricea clavata]|uniref:Uncharacterized protein n=1 Tax=Paramuricea clavata TaxID=317549 RepID=A0A6S7HRB8_PARCT|nr:Hypothetical predicted protein [Paramuricea clavata]